MACKVCGHPDRMLIENALLGMSSENIEETLKAVAQEYNVTVNELKVHALMHAQMGVTTATSDSTSIARQLKLKEADILSSVVNEYMVTLKTVGRRINELAAHENFGRALSKPVVELYLGTGGEIRHAVRTLAELNTLLNGPETSNAGGLHALANAILMSKTPIEE